MDESRNAETGTLDEEALDFVRARGGDGRNEVARAAEAGNLSDARAHAVLGLRAVEIAPRKNFIHPHAAELRDFFLKGHPGHEIDRAIGCGKTCVPVIIHKNLRRI